MTAAPGPARLRFRGVVAGAFVVSLVRPGAWAIALAGFLAGGGVIVVAWPILVLPTPTGLQNALGTPLSSLVFGGPTPGLIALIAVGVAVILALSAAGMLVGAWAERNGIAMALEAAADEGLAPGPADLADAPGVGRVALLRLASLFPVAVVAVLAWQPLYDAAYHELILPSELVTPLPLRVMRDVPGLLAALAGTWLLCDAAAAAGVRRLVVERRPVPSAWARGWADLVRRPHRVLGGEVLGLVVLGLLTVPSLLAAAVGWARLREILGSGGEPVIVAAAVLLWVAVWLAGLVLAAVGATFRAAVATLESARRP